MKTPRPGSSARLIVLGATAIVLTSVVARIVSADAAGRDALWELLAFGILMTVSARFEVALPNEVPYALGMAPGLGFALLGTHPVTEVIAVFAAGQLVGALIRLAQHQDMRIADMASQVIGLSGAVAVYEVLAGRYPVPPIGALETVRNISTAEYAALIGTILAMLVTILGVHALLRTIRSVEQERIPFGPVVIDQVRSTTALHLSVLSVAALLALAYPSLRYWSFPLFLAPLAATQFAFRQFASIRRTYLQTIRALSKVPEMAGYTQPGHSTRVAELSVAIARELGVTAEDLNQVEYAALLHDIGRVSMPDPMTASDPSGRLQLAVVGGSIVRETGHFPRVADMIERQHDAYRRRGEDTNRELPLGAKIIKVASAFDDLTKPAGVVGLSVWDALEKLHLGMAYEFDPSVIQSLTRVLEKRAVI